jgi:hypothetical protein
MDENDGNPAVYAPPTADLHIEPPLASPRIRFWVACLWCLILAPILLYGLVGFQAPPELFPVAALLAWLPPLSWVLSAHVQRFPARVGFVRMTIVSIGLTMAMAFFAVLGISIAAALVADLTWP